MSTWPVLDQGDNAHWTNTRDETSWRREDAIRSINLTATCISLHPEDWPCKTSHLHVGESLAVIAVSKQRRLSMGGVWAMNLQLGTQSVGIGAMHDKNTASRALIKCEPRLFSLLITLMSKALTSSCIMGSSVLLVFCATISGQNCWPTMHLVPRFINRVFPQCMDCNSPQSFVFPGHRDIQIKWERARQPKNMPQFWRPLPISCKGLTSVTWPRRVGMWRRLWPSTITFRKFSSRTFFRRKGFKLQPLAYI